MDDSQFQQLSGKLDKITKLLTIIALKDQAREQDKIELLDVIGFKTSEIARLLNKSPQNISTVLGNLRKKSEGGESTPRQETKQPDAKQSELQQELK